MPVNNISNEVFQISFEKFGSVVYVIKFGKDNILIDTSSEENGQELLNRLEKLNINPRDVHIILLTHRHYDHVGNLYMFPNAKVYDEKNIDELNLIRVRVVRVPGHTKDSLAFLYKDILFSGDTLFHLGIGRTDLKESVSEKMQESLNLLKKLNYDILCPGHV